MVHPNFIAPCFLGTVLPKTPLSSATQLLLLQDELYGLAKWVESGEIDEAICSYIYAITLEPNGLKFHCRGYEEKEALQKNSWVVFLGRKISKPYAFSGSQFRFVP